jgi:tRNA (cmo5U34)-methyltransferase
MQQQRVPPREPENWFDDDFVADWLTRQESRVDERRRQFAMVRSVILRSPDEPFRYLNIGAGDGWLDEGLLARFNRAEAVLLDGSPAMGARATERLAAYAGRFQVVQGDLLSPEWKVGLDGTFDLAVSTIAIHNLEDPLRIRDLYREAFPLMAAGSLFVNLDYVRGASNDLGPVFRWASADPDAGFSPVRGYRPFAGTVDEHLGWLREAGFAPAECFWKELRIAMFGGFKGTIRVPAAP